MLRGMRRGANSWVIKALLVLIALSFVVWGVGDDLGRSSRIPVVEAKNWIITPREFVSEYDLEFRNMQQRFGSSLDKKMAETLGLKQRTLQTLINKHLIRDAGRKLRLTISPAELRKNIAENQAFKSSGTFDKERYDMLLRNNRLTPKEYEHKLLNDMLNEQFQEIIGQFSISPEILVKDSFKLAGETRRVMTMTLNPADLEKNIDPDDAALESYMHEHSDRFMSPTMVKVRYILLNTDSVRNSINVSEEQIEEYYNENRDNYVQAESREARHILVKISGDIDDAAALKKIQQAEKRIKSGEPFEKVAKEVSDDVSAAQGGSLGQFSPGMMVKPFDDVAFALAEGEISKPVKTQFGYHLIRVDKINASKSKSLAEVRDLIIPTIAERMAVNQIYDRSITMEDQLFASGDLQGVSGDLNLHYRETGFFSKKDIAKLKGLEREQQFLDAAFTTAKGDISPVIELTNNRFFALEVLDRKEPKPLTLTEAKTDVLALYRQEKANEQAKELMEKANTALASGEDWETVAKSNPAIKTKQTTPFKRAGGKDSPSAKVRAAVFKLSLESPIHNGFIQDSGAYTLVRLLQITPADQTEYEKEAVALRQQLQQSLGYEQLSAYLNGLLKKSKIKINQEVYDQL
ncbi:MAG: SurA N-terminal domain-containing protein [Magnetococcales bacterium]|nr:SurA N-terminal domain-containing protein [Magnetococcales bacterium]